MSLRERDRLTMFRQVEAHQITLVEAADRLSLSYRQARRLWKRYREVGDGGLVHGLRGRSSNNQALADDRRDRAVELYRERYQGFGPTLAAEQLAERDGVLVDHETLRGWLVGAGLWKVKRQPRRSHRRRPRKACFGELVQLDGSDHHWFGPDVPRCVLMVMIDDATGRVLARFFEAETTVASMSIFREWALKHGLPGALYPDRHSIYRRNDKEADELEHRTGKRPLTRFGEAMLDLEVQLICAHSPQAKGRVERANQTFQDRLVKLLALEWITDMDQANAYLDETYLPSHNAKFAVQAEQAEDRHRSVRAEVLDAALCPVRDRRVVDKTPGGGCVSWRGRRLELMGKDAGSRRRREVVVRERLDGRVELTTLDGSRVLSSREVVEPPKAPSSEASQAPEASAKPTLVERVAGQSGPKKPAKNHPWRSPLVGVGSVAARCAHLHCADPHEPPTQGTLLLG